MPSGTKPLPLPMLIRTYNTTEYIATMIQWPSRTYLPCPHAGYVIVRCRRHCPVLPAPPPVHTDASVDCRWPATCLPPGWSPFWIITKQDEVITWKHFLYYWPFVHGILWWPADSPNKQPLMQIFYVSFSLSMKKLLNQYSRVGDLRHLNTLRLSLILMIIFFDDSILFEIPLKFISKGQIDKSTLVWVMK